MSLSTYRKKRHFNRTPEPAGKKAATRKTELRYVIQKHDASRLHYDFRLEVDGVLKSWAVPKGPSLDPSKKSLAVQVEDHPLDYGGFEGIIPKGEYGGGTVLLWDEGTWEPFHDPAAGLKSGKLHFALHGKKLDGEFSLVQMHGRFGDDGKNWLLMKLKDKFASRGKDILVARPESVKTDRSLEQIAGDRDDIWKTQAKKATKLTKETKSAMPTDLTPQLAVLSERPPAGDEWVHEIKFDGYRMLAFINAGKVRLVTRNGHDWTAKFSRVVRELEKLKVDTAVVDGEIVVLDADGRSDFQSLQLLLKQKEKADPVMYAFDLPFLDGVDLRESPLIERKKALEKLIKKGKQPRVRYSEHVAGSGDEIAAKACGMALEGIISKRIDSPYVSRRDASWLKSKCDHRQEFVIIGYTKPQGSRTGFGALLLGYHDEQGKLIYAGRVGTGFDDRMLGDMHKQLKALTQDKSPTHELPPARERRDAMWVKPTLVGEVRFTGWTRDGVLRHPAFIALRSDKAASKVIRETAVEPEKLKSGATKARSVRKSGDEGTETEENPKAAKAATSRAKKSVPASADSVAGVRLSHPAKVLYPDQGVTKYDVAAYYEFVAEWMTPHVTDRPLALVRCPSGQSAKCFFQRNWSNTLPKDVGKVDIGEGKTKEDHVAVANLPGLISLVQIGVLEVHTWNCHRDDIEHPDQIIFDLDPGEGVTWKQVVAGARLLRKTLDSLALPTFLKTSGGKGLHLTIPIAPNVDWDSAKRFTQTVAESLATDSDQFVANMRKDLRNKKIYIDYHRNGRGATAVAPYSTRSRQGAPVSMPISWEELGKLSSADQFTVGTARRHLEKRKSDPWRDFEKSRTDLRKITGASDA